MKYLYIAEKPSVMRAVQAVYEKNRAQVDAAVGGSLEFTALAGHVCRYLRPDEYPEYAGTWSQVPLPILPAKYLIGPIGDKTRIIRSIADAAKHCDGIIVGTDSDVEGCGIYYLLAEHLKLGKKKTLRYFESSMTDEEILSSLLSMSEFWTTPRDTNMTKAYLARSRFDWLVGMNATRSATLAVGEKLTIGRVKAPTLKLVYDNSMAIENFVPHSDYQAKVLYREGFSGIYVDEEKNPVNFETPEKAQAFIDSLTGAPETAGTGSSLPIPEAKILSTERKTVRTPAPQLYTLSRVAIDAGAKFNYTPAKSDSIVQALYEKGLVSYPRTDTPYVSEKKAAEFQTLLGTCLTVPSLEPFIRGVSFGAIKAAQKNRRIVNDAEVAKGSHDALLVTSKKPVWEKLSPEEQNIYDLIARRFTAQFLGDKTEEKTVLLADISGSAFKSTGSVTKEKGWSALYEQKEKAETIPAGLRKGSTLHPEHFEVHEKKSSPPTRLTMATLIAAMEHIDKNIEQKELRDVMKQAHGIGTQSSRSSITEELVTNGYMEQKGKNHALYITEGGKHYIESLKGFSITDPAAAAEWESMFSEVRAGGLDYQEAQARTVAYVSEFVREARNLKPLGNGSRYGTRNRTSAARGEAAERRKPGRGGKRSAGSFSAAAEEDRNREFPAAAEENRNREFPEESTGELREPGNLTPENKSLPAVTGSAGAEATAGSRSAAGQPVPVEGASCPWCGGALGRVSGGIRCLAEKEACGFFLYDRFGKVTPEDLRDLKEKKKTRVIPGIGLSKAGRSFDAALSLNRKGSRFSTAFVFETKQ